ncbi:MAG: hypothetical protein WBH05_07210 [Syntrophobacteria bacterium]
MKEYQALRNLPVEIQSGWGAELHQEDPTDKGVFQLVDIRPTAGGSYQGQRIVVLVVDEDGIAIPNVPVAFSFSTADRYLVGPDFLWSPPHPRNAFVVQTHGSGEIDQVQGSIVPEGGPGGVTVYLLDPEYSSDAVSGCGMLKDHTGLHLTFQLQRNGYRPVLERLAELEARVEGRGTEAE